MSITILIIAATVIISLMAFNNPRLEEQFIFGRIGYGAMANGIDCLQVDLYMQETVERILYLTWFLFFIGSIVESHFQQALPIGLTLYVIMYFGAVILSSAYDLFAYKNTYAYRSLGASGGVSAAIFSLLLFDPFRSFYLFFIPIPIPALVFGPLFLVFSLIMAKRGRDNINHIAHFIGSIIGFVFPLLFRPSLFLDFIAQIQYKLQ